MTSRRGIPYPGVGATMFLPEDLWQRSVITARSYGRKRAEAFMIWGGVVSGSSVTVTGLYIPRHVAQGYHVSLTPEETRWLLRRLRARDEKLVAQVHSHPFEAFHSLGDDKGAASFHVGYISIVIPHFGRGVAKLNDCAVFEHDGSSFVQLDPDVIDSRFVVVSLTEESTRGGR